jgi:hypothetical protein
MIKKIIPYLDKLITNASKNQNRIIFEMIKMIHFISHILLILNTNRLIFVQLENINININQIECMIHSEKYQFEYLYQSDDAEELIKSSIYVYSVENVANFEHIKWNLISIDRSLNVFYLRSHKLNQYMCSTSKRVNLFGRMMENRLEISNNDDKSCEWRLEKLFNELNNRTYKIWNVKYESELLYTSTHFFKLDKNKRGVYLMSNKNETNHENDKNDNSAESKRFNWNIDCFMGQFLMI